MQTSKKLLDLLVIMMIYTSTCSTQRIYMQNIMTCPNSKKKGGEKHTSIGRGKSIIGGGGEEDKKNEEGAKDSGQECGGRGRKKERREGEKKGWLLTFNKLAHKCRSKMLICEHYGIEYICRETACAPAPGL